MIIFEAPAITPGERCLYAERSVWDAVLRKVSASSKPGMAITMALRDKPDAAMVKVSLPPELARQVLAAAQS